MNTVYEADTGIEAHMIVNLLERHEIPARVVGEHLQSGVGELPAFGNVRVVVEDEQHMDKARDIIRQWQSEEVSREPQPAPVASSRKGWGSSVFSFVLGAVIAGAVCLWALRTPFYTDAADYDQDGQTDEWLYWQGAVLSRVDTDRNRDGVADMVSEYSRQGVIKRVASDNDFDEIFETLTTYKSNLPVTEAVDLNDNGMPDYEWRYEEGVVRRLDMFAPASRTIRKTEFYSERGVLTEARWDSDKDGVLDTLIKYDMYGEETERSRWVEQ